MKVAKKLNNEGVPIGILRANSKHQVDIVMDVDFYTKGGTQYGLQVFDNDKITISEIETGLYNQAMKAYRSEFGNKR